MSVNRRLAARNLARCHAADACEDLQVRLRVTRKHLHCSLLHLLAIVNGTSRRLKYDRQTGVFLLHLTVIKIQIDKCQCRLPICLMYSQRLVQPHVRISCHLDRRFWAESWIALFVEAEIVRDITGATQPEVFNLDPIGPLSEDPYNPTAS
jgi:hypothetical protein